MRATNIEWETDDCSSLPEKVLIPFSVNESEIVGHLSESYGVPVKSCEVDHDLSIADLYEWAKANGNEHLPLGLQFQDSGGTYNGDTYSDMPTYPLAAGVAVHDGQKYVLLS